MSNKIEQFRNAVEANLLLADQKYGTKLAGNVAIRFDIGGYRTAGQAGFRHGNFFLRFHPAYIEEHFDAMLNEVIPHEVAHVVGYAARELDVRRHNPNWKRVCIELGGNGERCHSMDVSVKPAAKDRRAQYDARRPFVYEDQHGRLHRVTAQMHKAMQEGKVFRRGGIRRYVAPEDLSYDIKLDGLVGKINKDAFVGKEAKLSTQKPKAAPKKRKQNRARKGGMSKAQIARNLIKLHFPAGPDQPEQDQIIAKIADVCGLSNALAKTYFNNNLTKAMTS